MAAVFGLARRNWRILNPPDIPREEEPLRFGILGAADIAPQAIITPARTHPDVVIQAVAARSQSKAKAFADKHGIPEVKATYQDILDDAQIDCVYIPLPNGLHFEWALRALKAGKHVLLEKPSANNAAEGEALFRNPLLAGPESPVLVEASHYIFHPAWALFLTYVTPADVASASASLWVPRWKLAEDDIRYQFDLAGGALMDLGCYAASVLVRIFGDVAEACEECIVQPASMDARCDRAFRARYRFPGGGYGEIQGDLKAPLDKIIPTIQVVHRPVVISGADARATAGEGQEVVRTRRLKFSNYAQPAYVHSIEVDDEFVSRKVGDAKTVVKRWKKSKTVTGYSFKEAGVDQAGEPYWTTYRYQLEQFVNKVRRRETNQWVDHETSVGTLRMIDMAYTAAKLPLRPSSEYR